MDHQQLLGVLLTTTEQQSATTDKLLRALKDQIAALAVVTKAAHHVTSGPVLRDAVDAAISKSLADASTTAMAALDKAAKPLLGNLAGVTRQAAAAETTLRNAVEGFGWRWMAICAVACMSMVGLAFALATWTFPSPTEIATLRAEKIALEANIDVLEKRGGRIRLAQCGKRLCAEASTNQGEGNTGWQGPWKTDAGVPLVILRGY